MKKQIFALGLLLAASIHSSNALAWEVGFCNSCSSQSSFQAFAEGLTSSKAQGTYDYDIVNYYSETIYEVTVIKMVERESGKVFIVSTASPAPNGKVQDFKTVKNIMEKDEILVTVPRNTNLPGLGSFGQWTPEAVYGHISSQWWNVTLAQNGYWSTAIKGLLGKYPTVVFVFKNGDVAKFKILTPAQPSVCCAYLKGTARDSDGKLLNDSGFSGIGGGGDGNYVNPNPPGATDASDFAVRTNTRWYFCTFVDGVLTSCYPI